MDNQIQLYRDMTSFLLEQDLAVIQNMDKRLRRRYQQGYDKGWEEARDLYCVTYFCSVCGGLLEVTSDNEKKAVRQYMKEHGWGHSNCVR